MTPEERIGNMTKAINIAIKVMGDRFGSTEEDVARAVQGLKTSLLASPSPVAPVPAQVAPLAAIPTLSS
jgi:hypothetical protein